MHELSLAENVLQMIEEAAVTQAFHRVSTVWLEIGQLSGVDPEAMRFCFETVVAGTLAAGARLEIVNTPGSGWCMACAKSVPLTEVFGACPECGRQPVQINGGTEMRVKELEVE